MNPRLVPSAGIAALLVTLLHAVMAVSQAPSLPAQPSWSDLNPVAVLTPETFANPPATDRPWVRVNTPAGITSGELKAEIAEMKKCGLAGLEIGQGTFPNTDQLIAILRTANQEGRKVSLIHGSTVSPAGYTFNEDNVRKTLLFTASQLSAGEAADITWTAPLPPSNARGFGGGPGGPSGAPPAPRRSTLIAVLAYGEPVTTTPDEIQAASALDRPKPGKRPPSSISRD